jgi:hypothetical protein
MRELAPDGTAWVTFYCITMLEMALELASGEGQRIHQAYEDMASKFLEHFVQIADAMNGETGRGLGANHRTGWTALVIRYIADLARQRGGTV